MKGFTGTGRPEYAGQNSIEGDAMTVRTDRPDDEFLDDPYFETERQVPPTAVFDASMLRQSVRALPARHPLLFAPHHTVAEAMRAMQKEHRGVVLVTEDGTQETRVLGIFTERDVLFRIIDRGQNPTRLPLAEVMTRDPECLPVAASVAWVLNKMSIGGFRHVPVVDRENRPVFVVSVKDVVEWLVERFPREILNLPPIWGGDVPRDREGA
jgi:CBS domain-containing protein